MNTLANTPYNGLTATGVAAACPDYTPDSIRGQLLALNGDLMELHSYLADINARFIGAMRPQSPCGNGSTNQSPVLVCSSIGETIRALRQSAQAAKDTAQDIIERCDL